jgi:hypothetical protein
MSSSSRVNFKKTPTNNVSIRLLPLTILRLYYLTKELDNSDPTYNRMTMFLLEIIQMSVAVVVSCLPFSRLLMTSVSSGLMTTNVRNHAPNFDGTADFNMSNIGQRFSQGAMRTPNSRLSKNSGMSKDSRRSRGLGSVSLISEPRNSKSWEVPWSSVKHTTKISNCSVTNIDGTPGSGSPSDSEQHIIRTTTEWTVNRDSVAESI